MKKVITVIIAFALIGAGVIFYIWNNNQASASGDVLEAITATPAPTPTVEPTPYIVPPISLPTPVPPTPTPTPTPPNNVNEAAPKIVLAVEKSESVAVDLTKPVDEIKPTPPPNPTPTPDATPSATPKPDVAAESVKPAATPKADSSTPKNGDRRTVNGQTQEYHEYFGWIQVETGGGSYTFENDPDGDGELSGKQVGVFD